MNKKQAAVLWMGLLLIAARAWSNGQFTILWRNVSQPGIGLGQNLTADPAVTLSSTPSTITSNGGSAGSGGFKAVSTMSA